MPLLGVAAELKSFYKITYLAAAADKVFARENPTSWKLTAFKYDYIPDKPIGLGNIWLRRHPTC